MKSVLYYRALDGQLMVEELQVFGTGQPMHITKGDKIILANPKRQVLVTLVIWNLESNTHEVRGKEEWVMK